MSGAYWGDLKAEVGRLLSESTETSYIVSPFISPEVLEALLSNRPEEASTVVLTSWRKDHLRQGVSSLETFDVCRRSGAQLLILSRLHAKVYTAGLTKALVGSANLTRAALDDGIHTNAEVLVRHRFVAEDRIELLRLIASATPVTEELADRYRKWLAKQPLPAPPDTEDLEDIRPPASEISFSTATLPQLDSPSRLLELLASPEVISELPKWERVAFEHDLAIFSPSRDSSEASSLATLRDRFFATPLISKLSESIPEEGIQFGKLKQWIRRHCSDVPIPGARELTETVAALMTWFPGLAPTEFTVRVPGRYSQVLYRRNSANEGAR